MKLSRDTLQDNLFNSFFFGVPAAIFNLSEIV